MKRESQNTGGKWRHEATIRRVTRRLFALLLLLLQLHRIVDSGRRIDSQDTHTMHLRELGDDANEENAQVDNDIEFLVIGGLASDVRQQRGHQHQELLGLRPRSTRIDLLIQGESIVFTLGTIIGAALDPMEKNEGDLPQTRSRLTMTMQSLKDSDTEYLPLHEQCS